MPGFLRSRSRSRRVFPAAGNPPAVPFRPGSWDVSQPVALYVAESGDTMVGIAERYLGQGSRWTEIRAAQGNGGTTKWGSLATRNGTMYFPGDGCTTSSADDPETGEPVIVTECTKDPWGPGTVFRMPEEAKQRMLALYESGEPRTAPSQGNAPGNFPGQNPLEPYGAPSGPVVEPPGPEPKPKPKGDGAGALLVLVIAAAAAVLS